MSASRRPWQRYLMKIPVGILEKSIDSQKISASLVSRAVLRNMNWNRVCSLTWG